MKLTDDELLKAAYLQRADDAITMALAARLEMVLDQLEILLNDKDPLNP